MNLEKIESRENRSLVEARKIRDGRDRRSIFIEGRRLVVEALRSPVEITHCFISEGFSDDGIAERVGALGVPLKMLPSRLFDSIAATPSPQGIIAIAKRPAWEIEDLERSLETSPLRLAVALKEINDPSNLGAVLRSVEAAGAAGVITTTSSTDAYSPRSLRSAMGSAFRVPIISNRQLDTVIDWATGLGITVTAADITAGRSYTEIDWRVPRLLVFGSEAHGLSDEDLTRAGELIRIPMENEVESLNLAVSAGIMLFESKRASG